MMAAPVPAPGLPPRLDAPVVVVDGGGEAQAPSVGPPTATSPDQKQRFFVEGDAPKSARTAFEEFELEDKEVAGKLERVRQQQQQQQKPNVNISGGKALVAEILAQLNTLPDSEDFAKDPTVVEMLGSMGKIKKQGCFIIEDLRFFR
jgi:hypothetical protein